MSAPEHGVPALDELRERLRAAAQRDVAARRPARRGRRRAGALVLVVLLGGGAAAGAADLISAGSPLPDARTVPPRYQPTSVPQLSVKAADEPLSWGVDVYRAADGRTCAVVGRVRGVQLGELIDGEFRAYAPGRTGVCSNPNATTGVSWDQVKREGRTVFYGIAEGGARRVTAVVDGTRQAALTGAGGAFLLVFKGSATLTGITAS